MKKFVLFFLFAIISSFSFATIVTITNVDFTFSPADVTINLGDTVVFSLGSSHNAVEVSETTWNANGTTPLPGFAVPLGGGTVTGLAVGVHFYVCQPHASIGMKGKITVNGSSGITDYGAFDRYFKMYPNPTSGIVNLHAQLSGFENNLAGAGDQSSLQIFNILGQKVYEISNIDLKREQELDLSSLPVGQYIMRISRENKQFSKILVKD